ncbi:MAG: hypothetical protein LQ342_005508 [Letrouitia transgressa]|nr:MAG: hypothetical protein LQ342_005508 [Letrouitia transgressa]
MRRVKIFSGSSHPVLVQAICDRLSIIPAKCDLKKFSNGETSVSIETSIRDQDVFIVQSGCNKINDAVMELLIMISACKGSSAKSITAVMPYFPYSRQSKKKSHRGAITARLFANLLSVAGVQHAPPTQGFFGHPVDNLQAEPTIAAWIRNNVPGWKEAVVVSKNPGGSKRVTSLADALKLNFGIITTDRRRETMGNSIFLDANGHFAKLGDSTYDVNHRQAMEEDAEQQLESAVNNNENSGSQRLAGHTNSSSFGLPIPQRQTNGHHGVSPLMNSRRIDSESPPSSRTPIPRSAPLVNSVSAGDPVDEYTDERARDVITGRLIQGHLVDDDHPSPVFSTMSGSISALPADTLGPSQFDDQDPMASSLMSTLSRIPSNQAFSGNGDGIGALDDEEEAINHPEMEHTITLVGNVRGKTVFIMDDMIDHCGTWIAAAETVVKRGGAKKVYCIATHGLFGYDSLEQMEDCESIDFIVVTNTYPISSERIRTSRKLVILSISNLLAEAIRRNHHGESISQLYLHSFD